MIAAIFQPEVSSLEAQVAALQAQIAAHTERISLLTEAESVADDSLEALRAAIHKVSSLAPSAVSNLRAAVLNLFSGNDSDGDNGNQPQPAPQPSSDDGEEQEEVHALPWHELPFDFEKQAVVEPEEIAVEILTGQSTEWACPLASPFTCTIEVAAPIAPISTAPEPEVLEQPYIELVPVNHAVAYQRRVSDGEIICCYLAANNKNRLKDWGSWLCSQHTIGTGFEVRESKRLTAFKHELKIWGMTLEQIERLAEANTQKSPPSNFGDAPKRALEPVAPAPRPLQLNDIGVGDIVRSTTVKHWEYRVLGITEDKFLDVERLNVTPQIRLGGRPEGFELVCKATKLEALTEEEIAIANESIQPPAPTPSALKYNPYPQGRRGAAANWEAYQAHKAEQRAKAQTVVIDAPQPAPVEQKIVSGDWVELLCNGDRYQVEEVDSEGIHLVTDDGNITVQADEVKLLMHIPDDWKPF